MKNNTCFASAQPLNVLERVYRLLVASFRCSRASSAAEVYLTVEETAQLSTIYYIIITYGSAVRGGQLIPPFRGPLHLKSGYVIKTNNSRSSSSSSSMK